ncbi:trypsin-like peptidase domain-containing protein [Bacillus sp. FJAT-45037]|uniref:trypsin-like peptidase domain-containing protein n=1 Tax=Bacillus sp. FJAT-45037 TaxID=2011007 RepID=UPI000C243E8B|nr:trypsin-like peptidase domain-containing protein [Bacillus sp. FJAT-45037]
MFCPDCGSELKQRSAHCPNCGKKRQTSKSKSTILLALFLVLSIGGGFVWFDGPKSLFNQPSIDTVQPLATHVEKADESRTVNTEPAAVVKVEQPKEETLRQLTEIIADAQENVFTIHTTYSQGSGFLYNESGIVVTNAHVVEGSIDTSVKTMTGSEHEGKVIGYSNETDVAIIKVPDFIGRTPSKIAYEDSALIGEPVIALGSPLGLENTASMGYVTGVNRDFVIDTFVYSNLYQISAPISPGSSGGPLLAQDTEEIIAINSAKDTRDSAIGFSIPIHTIHSLIEGWITQPMTEEEVYSQFYYSDGLYFFDNLWDYYDGGFFDGGDYSSDSSYFEYWDYDYEYWYDDYEYEDYEYIDDYDYEEDYHYFDDYDYDEDYEYFDDYDYEENYEYFDDYDYEIDYEYFDDYDDEEDWEVESFQSDEELEETEDTSTY